MGTRVVYLAVLFRFAAEMRSGRGVVLTALLVIGALLFGNVHDATCMMLDSSRTLVCCLEWRLWRL